MTTLQRFALLLLFGCLGAGLCQAQDDENRRKGRVRKQPPAPKEQGQQPQQPQRNQPAAAPSAAPLTGQVLDESTGEALIGVYIQVEGTVTGTLTNDDGNFSMPRPTQPGAKVVISMIGYDRLVLDVPANGDLKVNLKEAIMMTEEVVVTASRVSERLTESPVTIEKLDLRAVLESPTVNVYDAVIALKGVDMMSSSFSFKVINTRGFNSTTNTRFIQRLDGVDLQAPGLNIALGTLNGANSLDVESVELIPGSGSALYGPNAFNGLLEVATKSPFQYTGLSANLRMGANHVDGIDHSPTPYTEFAARYAQNFNDRLAFKINVSYVKGTDWYATDATDMASYTGTVNAKMKPGVGNPGYDGVNLYGDEISNTFDSLKVGRTGYREQDLTNYGIYSFKSDAAVHYRFKNKLELSAASRWASGSTVFQGSNRYTLKDFQHQVHRLELKGGNFFVRAYATVENAGSTFDTRFTGIHMNEAYKNNTAWFTQYLTAFSPDGSQLLNYALTQVGRSPLQPGNDADARAFAESDNQALYPYIYGALRQQGVDSLTAMGQAYYTTTGRARFLPGTAAFDSTLGKIKSDPNLATGSKFIDRTAMYHAEAQYDLSKHIDWAEVLVGGNYRLYDLHSEGTIFTDTAGNKIQVPEFGAYMQVTKRFMNERLRVTGSGRMDKSKNFNAQFSPRIAASLALGEQKQHHVRASLQTGFRTPTLQDQYINVDVSFFRFISGLNNSLAPFGLVRQEGGKTVSNAYEESSVAAFQASGDSTKLVRYQFNALIPEQNRSFDVGFNTLIGKSLYIDVNYYISDSRNFLVTSSLIGPKLGSPGTDSSDRVSQSDLLTGNYSTYRRAVNLNKDLWNHGVNLGVRYAFNSKFTFSGNYTYAELLTNDVDLNKYVLSFNTPKHKVNLSFIGRNLWKHWGFAVQHRWVDAMLFNEAAYTGPLAAYNLIDLQVSYHYPKIHSEFRLGATNALNFRHLEARASSTVGALYYFQISYDGLLK